MRANLPHFALSTGTDVARAHLEKTKTLAPLSLAVSTRPTYFFLVCKSLVPKKQETKYIISHHIYLGPL